MRALRGKKHDVGIKMLVAVGIFGAATIVFGFSRNMPLSLFCLAVLGAADMLSVFHSLNGLKITLIDFFPRLVTRIRGISIAFTAVFILTLIPTAWIMLGQAWDLARR